MQRADFRSRSTGLFRLPRWYELAMRILLVEDDRLLGDGVQVGLGGSGFTVDWVRDGEAALAALAAESFAAVVLDLDYWLLVPRRR